MFEIAVVGVSIFLMYAFGLGVRNAIKKHTANQEKGRAAERKVDGTVKQYARKKGGHAFRDILIPSISRGTSQLDEVYVSRYGATIFEVKAFAGIITGKRNDRDWVQTFPDGKKPPRKFLNPILQNECHVHALENLLSQKFPQLPIYSAVVFCGNDNFPKHTGVISEYGIPSHLDFMHSGEPILTDKEVREVAKFIKEHCLTGRKARQQHIARAQLAQEADYRVTAKDFQKTSLPDPDSLTKAEPAKPRPKHESEQTPKDDKAILLMDTTAQLTINKRTETIDTWFESAKRTEDGKRVSSYGDFDYFVCPYTHHKFPKSEAMDFYRGLWATYLKRNPELVEYMQKHKEQTFGNTMRCQKVLSMYVEDPDNFTRNVRRSDWYQNMAATIEQKKKDALNKQIDTAKCQCSGQQPGQGRGPSRPER